MILKKERYFQMEKSLFSFQFHQNHDLSIPLQTVIRIKSKLYPKAHLKG